MNDPDQDALDREISAMIRRFSLEREVRRRLKRRHFRRDVLPWMIWGLLFGASLGWLSWTIWR